MRIDLAGWTREATAMDHRDFLAIFEEADRLGFDGVWFNEFRFHQPRIAYPSPHLLAAAIFARTERLRVGTSVLVLPLHNPLTLAEEIGQLDLQSGGRLDIGIGRGTDPATFATLGIPHEEARARFEQGYRLLRQALTTGDVPAATGPWHYREAMIGPRPVQVPHPPIYVAGSTPETLGFALAEGLPLLLSLEPPENRQLDIYLALAEARAIAPRLASSSLSRYVVIGRTATEAADQLDPLLAGLEARRRHFATLQGRTMAPVDRPQLLAERFIWGDPEQCHRQLAALSQRRGIDQIRCVFNGNGVLGPERALQAMRLFAREVIPTIRKTAALSDA
jgi:alkanesulfonate monooxygenase SsuD/methylene tetrahydromethanopterin reductase-like flavin-dependent oxidoreductase (luciferase family)